MSDIQDNNIEQLFRDRFNDFEANVDPSVWEAVQSQIPAPNAPPADGGLAQSGGNIIFGQFSTSAVVAVTSIAAAAIIAIGIYNYTSEDEAPIQSTDNELVEQDESMAPIIEEQKEVDPDVQNKVLVVEDEKSTSKDEVLINEQETSTNEVKASEPDQKRFTDIVNNAPNEPSDPDGQSEMLKTDIQVEDNSSPINDAGLPDVAEQGTNESEDPEPTIPPVVTPELISANIEHQRVDGSPYTVKFKNLGQGSFYEWDMGDGFQSIEDDLEYTFNGPGEYAVKLTVRADDGRTKTDEVIIKMFEPAELILPESAFSPNGDQIHDVYDVEGKNIQQVTVKVFTLDGQRVFISNSFENDWAGNDDSGRPLPEGQYAVVIEAIGADSVLLKPEKVFISLFR